MSYLSREEQERYLAWYDANVRTREDAIKANQILANLEQQAAQRQAEDKQESAQNKAALTSIGGAIAAPVLYSAGSKLANGGLLGLGGAGTSGAATGAAGAAGVGATGATTAGATTAAATTPAALSTGAANAGTGASTGGGLFSLGTLAPAAGVAGGLALGAKGAKDLLDGKTTKGWEGWGGRATLGIATGGLSEVARAAGLGRKTTKDYQDERWGALGSEFQGLKEANHPGDDDGIWKTGKYAGQKWSFDKAQDLAKDDPSHFIGVLGNAETFGKDWLSTPEDKQKQVVSQLVNQGLYTSDKGDVLISGQNQQKAKDIYAQIMGAQ